MKLTLEFNVHSLLEKLNPEDQSELFFAIIGDWNDYSREDAATTLLKDLSQEAIARLFEKLYNGNFFNDPERVKDLIEDLYNEVI